MPRSCTPPSPDEVMARIHNGAARPMARLHTRSIRGAYVLSWEAEFGVSGRILSTTDWNEFFTVVKLALYEFRQARANRKPMAVADMQSEASLLRLCS